MSANIKTSKKILFTGIICLFVLTVLYHLASVFVMIIEMSSMYSYKTLSYVLQVLRDVLDLSIYATGIALVLAFVRLKNKKFAILSYTAVLLVLFLDYGVSFTIDFAIGTIDGVELWTAIYIILNIIARAALYALTVFFAVRIAKSANGKDIVPVPFVSGTDPTSKMLIVTFLIRIAPYLLFEIYSNVTGIIEYGFDMTGADILSIISAYAEILLSGALVYIVAYLFVLLFLNINEKAERKSE